MPKRAAYEDSCQKLQALQLLGAGEIPSPLHDPPRHDGEGGVRFFQAMLAELKLDRLTLPRTFISRSELRACSLRDTDLSESVANWNDFIKVDFSKADLSRGDFRACLFEGVKFKSANLAGADFRYCAFNRCDFTGAEMSDVKLTHKLGRALKLTPEQLSVIDWQSEDGDEPPGG